MESVPGLSPDLGGWPDISLAYPHISPRSLPVYKGALPVGVGVSVSLSGKISFIRLEAHLPLYGLILTDYICQVLFPPQVTSGGADG